MIMKKHFIILIMVFIGMLFFITSKYKSYKALKNNYEDEVVILTSIVNTKLHTYNTQLYSDEDCKLFEHDINNLFKEHFDISNKSKYQVYLDKDDGIVYIYLSFGNKKGNLLDNIPFNNKHGKIFTLKDSFFMDYLFQINYNIILATITAPSVSPAAYGK